MIIVLLAVFVLITIVGFIIYKETYNEGISIVGVVGTIIFAAASLGLCVQVSKYNTIDDKIEMYQEENSSIELQISECVKQYQQYESDIFAETTSNNAITLVSLYPELKSDSLVSKQLEVYVSNNRKIKELKEAQIDGSVVRWWLYFGGGKK